MKTLQFEHIRSFVGSPYFDLSPNEAELVLLRIKQLITQRKKIRLIYGETYDSPDITIDSLKYYLALHIFASLIREAGGIVEPTIVIADKASILNDSVQNKDEITKFGKQRVKNIQRLIDNFNLDLQVTLMSKLFKVVRINYKLVEQVMAENEEGQRLLMQTVPTEKLLEERKKGFRYAIEEISLITEFDLKIGPIREKFYDQASGIVSEYRGKEPIAGLYMRPTYPLGMGFDFFITTPNVTKFGVTPYKINSYKLAKNRIILGKSDLGSIKELVDTSFRPKVKGLPDPVYDLYLIGILAQKVHAHELNFSQVNGYQFSTEELLKLINEEILQWL